jgi:hypothetical protein
MRRHRWEINRLSKSSRRSRVLDWGVDSSTLKKVDAYERGMYTHMFVEDCALNVMPIGGRSRDSDPRKLHPAVLSVVEIGDERFVLAFTIATSCCAGTPRFSQYCTTASTRRRDRSRL